MKRTILVMAVVALLAALMAPDAVAGKKKKKPKSRTFEGTYTCPCGFQVGGIGPGWRLGSGEGGFELPVLQGEGTVRSLELKDDSGTPIFFSISQDVDGDGTQYEHTAGEGCGKLKNVPLEPGAPVVVFVYSGTCDTGLAVATGGTFTAVLGR